MIEHSLHTFPRLGRSNRKRVGRGTGSGHGKTAGRGVKGAGSRSGHKRRHGREGGQLPLHLKLPIRGFSRARFKKIVASINFWQLEKHFEEGELVSLEALCAKSLIPKNSTRIKVLSEGELKKKLKFSVHAYSAQALKALQAQACDCQTL